MKVGFALKHHDWEYVERRGGIELLTQLRGAEDRAQYRRASIDRAFERFEAAETEGRPEPEICGLGLLVMQRALLAAEDLGGLVHAFRGGNPWSELRAATIDRIDEAFEWAVRQRDEALARVFVLGDRELFEAEGYSEIDIGILLRARERVIHRWATMLESSGSLWLSLRAAAKATMHGFPIVACEFVFRPPGGGVLAEDLPDPPYRCSLLIASTEHRIDDHTSEIRTERAPIRLDRHAVARYARNGKVATRLCAEISAAQAASRMLGYAAGIPFRLAGGLSQSELHRLDELAAQAQEE